jgi:hypothetical protein
LCKQSNMALSFCPCIYVFIIKDKVIQIIIS